MSPVPLGVLDWSCGEHESLPEGEVDAAASELFLEGQGQALWDGGIAESPCLVCRLAGSLEEPSARVDEGDLLVRVVGT